jgi:glycosyltransferase involved in cell wall biosynthesis
VNIVILQHTLNPTVIGWIRGLEARGNRVLSVVSRDTEPYGGWPEDLEVVVLPDVERRSTRLLERALPGRQTAVHGSPRVRDLRATMVAFGADAVLVKIYSVRNVVGLLVALSLGLRRVAWIEQVPPPNIEWRILRLLGVLPRRFFTALDARPGGIADPVVPPVGGLPVITYAPVLPRERARGAAEDPPVRILTVAAFWDAENKRQHWVLEAARDAGLLDGRCRFTFVGVGKRSLTLKEGRKYEAQRRLGALIDELGIAELVDLRVNVPYREMPAVYGEHDLLLLPSVREQFGMVVPEAMAHGLAVVASASVGSRGCIVPGVTGELFDTHDREGLARILGKLVEQPERIQTMGRAGRAFIEEHASPDHTARLLEALLEG